MKLQRLIIATCVGLFSGCCTPWKGDARITLDNGTVLCAKHRIPLVTVRAYTFRDTATRRYFINTNKAFGKAAACYPNLWPVGVFKEAPKDDTYSIISVSYCPQCVRAAERILK
jgi:hypothetical protein